jgi:hypothetical protein
MWKAVMGVTPDGRIWSWLLPKILTDVCASSLGLRTSWGMSRLWNKLSVSRKDMNDGQRFKLAILKLAASASLIRNFTGKDESPRHEATGTRETPIPLWSLPRFLFFEAVSFLPSFLALPMAVFHTLKSAIMPRSKFSSAFGMFRLFHVWRYSLPTYWAF